MTIDLDREVLVLLKNFGRTIRPRPVPYNPVRRWCKYGCFNRHTKQFVKLDSLRTPTGRATTQEAYHRFLRGLNEES